jgi:plastocyanin
MNLMKQQTARRLAQLMLVPLTALVGAAVVACGGDSGAAGNPGERTVYLQATEQDARRGVDQTAFPQHTRDAYPHYFGPEGEPFESAGMGGYYLFMTSDDEWRVGSYMYLPQEMIVYEGERITLEILGVRGNEHHTILVDPDGENVGETTVERGGVHTLQFTAEKPGIYELICVDHPPTMTTYIHVLKQ